LAFDIDELWSIDPTTGARAILKSKPAGGPPWPGDDNTAEVDPAGNRIIATTEGHCWVMALELTAPYDIVHISRDDVGFPAIGSGPEMDRPHGLTLDLANNRALVVDDAIDHQLFTVDLTSGDRVAMTGINQGMGPVSVLAHRVAYHSGA